jgi:hypothetical protein
MTMWGHLTEESLLDLVFGKGDEGARRHAEECAACRARVADAQEALRAAEHADVPEPSPLYWEAFRRQVGRRIEEEPAARPALWRFVPAFAALAATLAIGLALLARSSGPVPSPATQPTLPAWSPLPAADEDVGLTLIEALAPSADAASVSALAECPVEECLAGLSNEESRAVAESLRQQLSGRTL